MMRKIVPFILVIHSLIVIPSCKKGEDDPFISFRSRDARITAKWKLVNYESQSSYNGSSSTQVLNGSIYTSTNSSGSYSYSYSKELEINSDGTYKITTIRDGETSSESSIWYWINGTQNKSGIYLNNDYIIDRLSRNDLILRNESNSSYVIDGITSNSSSKSIQTYERQ